MTAELRRYFRIGPRTRRHRAGQDLHREIIDALHLAATQPGYYTERTEQALRHGYGAALGWDKHVAGYRLPGDQVGELNALSPYQLTVILGQMVEDGVTNTGEAERWFAEHRR